MSTIVLSKKCENCGENASQICGTCQKNNFIGSERLGRYCSRDCQSHCYHSHKYLHKIQKKMNSDKEEINFEFNNITFESIVLVIQEIIARLHTLPILSTEGVFSLLLVGTLEEVSFVYDALFEYLEHEYSAKGISLNHLHIFLCGHDNGSRETERLGHVSVTHLPNPHHEDFHMITECSLAVLFHVDWTCESSLYVWSPLVRQLIKEGVPSVVTSKASSSLIFRRNLAIDGSAASMMPATPVTCPDEIIYWRGACTQLVLERFFQARIIVGNTANALLNQIMSTKHSSSKSNATFITKRREVANASYVVFQSCQLIKDGSLLTEVASDNTSVDTSCSDVISLSTDMIGSPPISAVQCIKEQHMLFLAYHTISARIEDDNTSHAVVAEAIAGEIEASIKKGDCGEILASFSTTQELADEVQSRANESLLPGFIQKQRARTRAKTRAKAQHINSHNTG